MNLQQSWVDFLTNNAFVSTTNTESFTNVFLGQKYPPEIYFSFIHEATHHWCFNSIVGNSLFFLRMQTLADAQRTLSGGPVTPAQIDKLNTDDIRYTFLLHILNPITEGLALFAEYDSCPSPTEAVPQHLIFTSIAYSNLTQVEVGQQGIAAVEKNYTPFLYRMRLELPVGLERKKALLLSPLSYIKSPYLVGYLFIKNIWTVLTRKNTKFSDPNLFLQFMRSYFFNDVGWMAALYKEGYGNDAVMELVYTYFTERCEALETLDPAYIDLFEKDILDLSKIKQVINIATPKDVVAKGDEQLNALYQEVLATGPATFTSRLKQREYFRVYKLPAYIDINGPRVLFWVPVPTASIPKHLFAYKNLVRLIGNDYYRVIMSFPNIDNLPVFQGKGTLENFRSFDNGFPTCIIFSVNRQLTYSYFSDSWSPENKALFLEHYAHTGDDDFEVAQLISEAIDLICSLDPDIRETNRMVTEVYDDMIREYYEYSALSACPEEELQKTAEKMATMGFFPFFTQGEEEVDLFTLITLANSLNIFNIETLTLLAEQTSIDLPGLLPILKQDLKRNNLDILLTTQKYVAIYGA
ncbi:hypothetical protein ACX0G9_30060 [Flavitalea flava]